MLAFAKFVEKNLDVFSTISPLSSANTDVALPDMPITSDPDSVARLQKFALSLVKKLKDLNSKDIKQLAHRSLPNTTSKDPVVSYLKSELKKKDSAAICGALYQILGYRWDLHKRRCKVCRQKPAYPYCITCYVNRSTKDPEIIVSCDRWHDVFKTLNIVDAQEVSPAPSVHVHKRVVTSDDEDKGAEENDFDDRPVASGKRKTSTSKRQKKEHGSKDKKDVIDVDNGDFEERPHRPSHVKEEHRTKSIWTRNAGTKRIPDELVIAALSDSFKREKCCSLCHVYAEEFITMSPCEHALCTKCFDILQKIARKQIDVNPWARIVASCCPTEPGAEYWRATASQCPFCGQRCELLWSSEEKSTKQESADESAEGEIRLIHQITNVLSQTDSQVMKIVNEAKSLLNDLNVEELQSSGEAIEVALNAEYERLIELIRNEEKIAERRCREGFEAGLDEMIEERKTKLRRIAGEDSASSGVNEAIQSSEFNSEKMTQLVESALTAFEKTESFQRAEQYANSVIDSCQTTSQSAYELVQQLGNLTMIT